ncbi:hypothetical protein HY637_00125 [Candidatus Woesearchaeota archaeon]|nr:hypothetical protein [Candidatus Woesearchaeota archaeon]
MASKIGQWAFLVGLALAVVFAFVKAGKWEGIVTLVLVIAGLVVGFLNITEKETTPFLIAAVALMATSAASSTKLDVINDLVPNVGTWLQNIVVNIGILATPAAVVVALKAIKSLAQD